MHAEKNGGVRPTVDVTSTGSQGCDEVSNWWIKNWITTATVAEIGLRMIPIRLNMDRPIFSSDHPMSIRGISFAPHRSSTIIIPSHGMTVYQHHDSYNNVCSDVALPSYDTDLMRCSITCSLDSRSVCSTSLTVCFISCYTVTRIAFFRLYCWRVFWLRFFLAGEFDYCWVTVEGGSNCGACGVGEIDKDDLALDTSSSLAVNLFVIARISRLKSFIMLFIMLFIIAYTASIVINISAV